MGQKHELKDQKPESSEEHENNFSSGAKNNFFFAAMLVCSARAWFADISVMMLAELEINVT
jgi:hypothetical protein